MTQRQSNDPWAEAKVRFGLSNEHVRRAKDLKLNPMKLRKWAVADESWKKPLPEFIDRKWEATRKPGKKQLAALKAKRDSFVSQFRATGNLDALVSASECCFRMLDFKTSAELTYERAILLRQRGKESGAKKALIKAAKLFSRTGDDHLASTVRAMAGVEHPQSTDE